MIGFIHITKTAGTDLNTVVNVRALDMEDFVKLKYERKL